MADKAVGIFGAGGHAKVVFNLLQLRQYRVRSVFDSNPAVNTLFGAAVVHVLEERFMDYPWVIAIGSNQVRQKIATTHPQLEYVTVSHPQAIIDHTVALGAGTVVIAGAIINAATTIGNQVIINTGATVDHDCSVASFVHIGPKATLCGEVSVGEGTLMGAGSIAIPGVKIGKWCIIGAGTTVVRDIPDFSVVVGNPGRIIHK